MRSPTQDKERIKHILEAIESILNFTEGYSFEDFTTNVMLRHAVFHNFVIIGEAANMLTKEYRDVNDLINWGEIIGMRNFIFLFQNSIL